MLVVIDDCAVFNLGRQPEEWNRGKVGFCVLVGAYYLDVLLSNDVVNLLLLLVGEVGWDTVHQIRPGVGRDFFNALIHCLGMFDVQLVDCILSLLLPFGFGSVKSDFQGNQRGGRQRQ